MKGFLSKLMLFGGFAIITHVIAGYHMNGNTDPMYLRLTPQDNNGLILGTSRAAQAICPDDILCHKSIFNASFTLYTSPYGDVYFNYIKKQMNRESRDQVFVFCVDPWSLSTDVDSITEEEILVENKMLLATTQSISLPNWEFLIEQFAFGWGRIIREHYHPSSDKYLHKNGWLEVKRKVNKLVDDQNRANKIMVYKREAFESNHPSAYRMLVLKRMIQELRVYGKVIMVRLPVHPDFFELEKAFWPSFEDEMQQLAKDEGVFFWSPKELNVELPFNDGHHMNREGSHRFGRLLNEQLVRLKASK